MNLSRLIQDYPHTTALWAAVMLSIALGHAITTLLGG